MKQVKRLSHEVLSSTPQPPMPLPPILGRDTELRAPAESQISPQTHIARLWPHSHGRAHTFAHWTWQHLVIEKHLAETPVFSQEKLVKLAPGIGPMPPLPRPGPIPGPQKR